jgi:hypothetical protein
MRRLSALLLMLAPALLQAGELRPDSSGAPIFRMFPLVHGASEQLIIDHQHPLLSVESVADFLLKADKRRVRVVLTPEDAMTMTSILQTYNAVGIIAGESTAVLSGTRFDGSLTFDNPVAAYLRQRFHVKPDSNEVVPPPAKPFAVPATLP